MRPRPAEPRRLWRRRARPRGGGGCGGARPAVQGGARGLRGDIRRGGGGAVELRRRRAEVRLCRGWLLWCLWVERWARRCLGDGLVRRRLKGACRPRRAGLRRRRAGARRRAGGARRPRARAARARTRARRRRRAAPRRRRRRCRRLRRRRAFFLHLCPALFFSRRPASRVYLLTYGASLFCRWLPSAPALPARSTRTMRRAPPLALSAPLASREVRERPSNRVSFCLPQDDDDETTDEDEEENEQEEAPPAKGAKGKAAPKTAAAPKRGAAAAKKAEAAAAPQPTKQSAARRAPLSERNTRSSVKAQ